MPNPPALSILLVDDEEVVHQTIGDYLRESGHRLDEAHNSAGALMALQTADYDLALIDFLVPGLDGFALVSKARELCPRMQVVITTRQITVEMAVQALRLGAMDVLIKPIKLHELDAALGKAAQGHTWLQDRGALRDPAAKNRTEEDARESAHRLVGISAAMSTVRDQIRQVVDADCDTVLITGETGTGKEVVAREIHAQAGLNANLFVAVSCPALPESLVESELFGAMKGGFTGATADRAGCFELANGGTLLLDEITDFSEAAQAALLRVLESRTLRRVGGVKEIAVDLRVIAATNTPLEQLVETGRFRRDLFYRLNGYTIHLTPLRERREDIGPLAEHFLSLFAARRHYPLKGFSKEAAALLRRYDYPGNARELRHIVEHAAIQRRSGQILPDHLAFPASSENAIPLPPAVSSHPDQTRIAILRALEHTRWNRRHAARNLGISYSTLLYQMQKLRIP